MSEIIFVKPVDGAKVFHPDQPHLVIPEKGKRVRRAPYWNRMKEQGVIEISEDPDSLVEDPAPPQKEEPVVEPDPVVESEPVVETEPVVEPEKEEEVKRDLI